MAAACASHPRSTTTTPVAHTRLVVLIVIDQYPSWAFERDRPFFTGGVARLLREGGYVARGELTHANPFTAPGHATIGTGATPARHGIVGNTWYRRDLARVENAEFDPASPVFQVAASHRGADGDSPGASGRALRIDGVVDVLRAAHPAARSVAIALKPRAAAFMLGRKPELAIWYDSAAGGMTTSRAYSDHLPPWLRDLARTKPVDRFFQHSWQAGDPSLLARITHIEDAALGEGDQHGLGVAFPHNLAASDKPAQAFIHTPFADQAVLEAAYAALDAMALGTGSVPDVLGLGFNAHDHAGHLWGPDSWEAAEIALRLDGMLGDFFRELDRRFGADGWAAVLTSDHGATPIVDRARRGRRIPPTELMQAVDRALGSARTVASVVSSNIYLRADAPHDATSLDAAAAALAKVPNIAAAGRSNSCPTTGELAAAICAMLVPGEAGELYAVPAAGSLISDYATGSHHDAPFADNRWVPIIVRAPGTRGRTATATQQQIAPTLAALLGIAPPSGATAGALFVK